MVLRCSRHDPAGDRGSIATAVAAAWLVVLAAATAVMGQDATATFLSCAPNPSTFGEIVTCTATVTSAGGVPTGTVLFQVDGASDVVVPVDALGNAAFTNSLSVDVHTITAVYTPNTGAFLGSGATPVAQTVDPVPTTPAAPALSVWGLGSLCLLLLVLAANRMGAGSVGAARRPR